MGTHIGSHRKDVAQATIKAKIRVLERYAKNGIPEGAYVPKNLADFRRWEDALLGLERIGSPNTLDQLHNIQLKKRAQELILQLTKDQKRKSSRAQTVSKQNAKIKEQDRLTGELTSQLHVTRHELNKAQQSESRCKKRVEELEDETAELRRKLSTLIGLKPVSSREA
jgi:hypothetical protein